jgi:Domain of unknown function (DUF4166)
MRLKSSSFGLIEFAFRVIPDALGLRYLHEYTALRLGPWQLRSPRWAAPRLAAQVSHVARGALTEVEISARLFGRVLRYAGIVEPSSKAPDQ